MNQLEKAVLICREKIYDRNLSPKVIERYNTYLNKLLKCGIREGIEYPCQKLFDIYLSEHTNRNNLSIRRTILRWIDEFASSNCVNDNGILFNLPSLISEDEINAIFNEKSFPIENGVFKFDQMISYTLALMKIVHGKSTYGQYVHTYGYFRSWLIINDKEMFDRNVIKEYLDINEKNYINELINEWVYKIRKRSMNILLEVSDTGEFKWHNYVERQEIEGWLEELIKEYLNSNNLYADYSDKYVSLLRYVFIEIVKMLEVDDINQFKELSKKNFEELTSKIRKKFSDNSISTIYPIAKKIVGFLFDKNLLDVNYSFMFFSLNNFRKYNPCIISKNDELKIINHLESCSLRNKAIILLAIRYGLRDSDICELKFEEIDWYKETITIRQKKTKEPLVLPLLSDVGNAIVDYMENERPKVSNPYVFLRAQRPYIKIKSAYCVCSRIMDRLEIKTSNNKGKGIHVFRYTLAKRLLETQTPYQVITDSLGHISNNSDNYYYSIDDEKLRMCCLDARWIGVKTWK